MTALTQKQADTLSFIKEFINENGFSPTRKEIGANFDVQPNAAQVRVTGLINKGALTAPPGKSRSIRPVKGFRVKIKEEI